MRRNNRMAKREKKRSKKIKVLTVAGFIALLVVGIFGSHFLTSTETVEASLSEEIHKIEEKVSETYIDDEEDIDLKNFESNESLSKEIQNLMSKSEIEEETERLRILASEWEIITDMAFVKNELEERIEDGEIIWDEALPDDFEIRLESLKSEKKSFHKKYFKLYEDYLEISDSETEDGYDNMSVEELKELLFVEEGVIDWKLTDGDLNIIYYRLEELGASDLSGHVIVELARRQAERGENVEAVNESVETEGELDTSLPSEENQESDQSQSRFSKEEGTASTSSPSVRSPYSSSNRVYQKTSSSDYSPPTFYNPPAPPASQQPADSSESTVTNSSESIEESTSLNVQGSEGNKSSKESSGDSSADQSN